MGSLAVYHTISLDGPKKTRMSRSSSLGYSAILGDDPPKPATASYPGSLTRASATIESMQRPSFLKPKLCRTSKLNHSVDIPMVSDASITLSRPDNSKNNNNGNSINIISNDNNNNNNKSATSNWRLQLSLGDRTVPLPTHFVQKKKAPKQVRFTPYVTVHYVDNSGRTSTVSEEMCIEPKETYRCYYVGARLRGNGATKQPFLPTVVPHSPPFGGPGDHASTAQPTHQPSSIFDTLNRLESLKNRQLVVSESMPTRTYGVMYIDDPEQGIELRFALPIGSDYSADDVVVKANVNGSRIRVLATKLVFKEDGTADTVRMNERYILPVEIDPYMVDATFDTKGNLSIQAPLLTPEKKRSLLSSL